MRSFRNWIWIFIALAALFLAFTFGMKFKWPTTQTTESSTILLEKIRTVAKLVTAEGQFAEIYEYKESFPLAKPFFDKKALIRVRATVSVGYDLSEVNLVPDEASKTIVISNLPTAEIISVEHDLDYYDITEGFFNQFSTEDYNTLNARAKEFVISKVRESTLMDAADEKRDELLEVIRFMAEQAGWKVLVIGEGALTPKSPEGDPLR
jgi:hypothetical protein